MSKVDVIVKPALYAKPDVKIFTMSNICMWRIKGEAKFNIWLYMIDKSRAWVVDSKQWKPSDYKLEHEPVREIKSLVSRGSAKIRN